MDSIKRGGCSCPQTAGSRSLRTNGVARFARPNVLAAELGAFLPAGQQSDVLIMSHSEGGESECCTDPDPDPGGDHDPDVDTDGPDGGETPGGDDPPDDAPPGDDPPGGTPPEGGDDPGPGDDLYDIWVCWNGGECPDDTGPGGDTGDRDDTGDTGDTGGGDTGGGGFPGGPIDSGPML